MEYKDVLRYYLDEAGMRPAELSAKLKASRSTIGNIMQGDTKEPSLHKAYAIARALGVSVDDMLGMLYGQEYADD